MIIIRGQNYYPQDIEISVQEVSGNLRKGCSAALGIKVDNEEKLVFIQEIKENTGNYESLMSLMHDHIATNHGISCFEIVLIPARTIPKTANGKIKRRECQAFYLEGKLKIVAQKKWEQGDLSVEKISDLSEEITLESLLDLKPEERKEKLQNYLLWSLADLLEMEQNQINPKLPLDEIGLDSSGLAEFRLTLEDVLGQDIEEEYFMEKPSLEDIIAKTCLAMG